MLAKDEFPDVSLRYSVSLQGGWPMVEHALQQQQQQQARITPFSEADEQAARMARNVEARTRLPRTGSGAPASLDREMARALADAGYMPLADYVALYGDDGAAGEGLRPVEPRRTMSVTESLSVAFPRRQIYRATIVRCTFTKSPTKSPPRRARPKRRA